MGEIVLGYEHALGDLEFGPQHGITDYSRKEFDTFGNPILIERSYAETAVFPIAMEAADARRVKRTLARLRATPAVYHAGEDWTAYGLTIYGFFRDLPFVLESPDVSRLQPEGEGLT